MSNSILCSQLNQKEICISIVSNDKEIYRFTCDAYNLCEELPATIASCSADVRNRLLTDFLINDLVVDIDDKHNITSKRILISFFTGLLR